MPVISIPKPLRDKLGEEATEALTEVIRAIDLDARKDALALAEERLERRLTEEISKVNIEIRKLNERITEEISKVNIEIGKVNERITEKIGKVYTKIAETESRLIRWMFIFWIGQIAVLSGIIFAIVR